LQKAVVLDAGNIEARLALARDMADAGESALATAHAEAVLAARPGNVAAKRILRELSSKI
jgi:cytochrome c-type biogenesis protein CcmH/NrfG